MKLAAFKPAVPAFAVIRLHPATLTVSKAFPELFTTQLEADQFARKQNGGFVYLTVQTVNALCDETHGGIRAALPVARPVVAAKASLEAVYQPRPRGTNKQGKFGITASEDHAKTILRKK